MRIDVTFKAILAILLAPVMAKRSGWMALIVTLPLTCEAGVQVGAQAKVSLTLHEPVIADVVLWNVTPDAVEIRTGQASEESYRVTITRPNGELVTAGKPLWAQAPDTMTEVQMAKIGPAQSYSRPVLLNEWFPFDEVGRYDVSVALPGVEGVAYFEVEVSPRDEDRLRSTCERLAADASQRGAANRLFAARALGFVSDDLAIPYLARVASAATTGSGLAVEGLRRIGDLNAVSALALLTHQGDAETQRQSRSALAWLRGSTKSESVKQAITAVLGGGDNNLK